MVVVVAVVALGLEFAVTVVVARGRSAPGVAIRQGSAAAQIPRSRQELGLPASAFNDKTLGLQGVTAASYDEDENNNIVYWRCPGWLSW